MGLLTEGHPLDWEESKAFHAYIKTHGIEQFLSLYRQRANRKDAPLRWGDEVEYFICHIDENSKTTSLPLRAPEILQTLENAGKRTDAEDNGKGIVWHPEYANWMLEATPGKPYGGSLEEFLEVERNMLTRRKAIQDYLLPGEQVFTMTCFPRMGTENFTEPRFPLHHAVNRGVSNSSFIPDEAINPHPRFPTLTANIRKRRGEKVRIAVPIYQDTHTDATLKRLRDEAGAITGASRDTPSAVPPPPPAAAAIDMDCMAFGMGAGCLQVTFQARDIAEARFLYDQLAVVAPLMLALTAATPIWRGALADTDARWDVISACVDDRDAVERGHAPPPAGRTALSKSRYSSIDCFISDSPLLVDGVHNDVECAVNEGARRRLEEGGIDPRLARHVAHLFVRDPLVVFADRVEMDDEACTEHFESLQSTNWNTVRFKPPPAGATDIEWRVEFRPMELSLTDYENAAHSVFIMLLSRAILALNLNLYMPISKVDDNMQTAHRRAAVTEGKFWMRSNVRAGVSFRDAAAPPAGGEADPQQLAVMSLGDVFNGDGRPGGFPGLVNLVREYLDSAHCHGPVRERFDGYLELISDRAAGRLLTTAGWIRNQVLTHPDYGHDSDVPQSICYDLMRAAAAVAAGSDPAPALLGDAASRAAAAARASAAPTPHSTPPPAPPVGKLERAGLDSPPRATAVPAAAAAAMHLGCAAVAAAAEGVRRGCNVAAAAAGLGDASAAAEFACCGSVAAGPAAEVPPPAAAGGGCAWEWCCGTDSAAAGAGTGGATGGMSSEAANAGGAMGWCRCCTSACVC